MEPVTTVTSADGTRLALERVRDGAVPLVFVNGSFGGLRSWDVVIDHLPDEWAAWTYARRGYPPSDPARAGHTFADDAADLAAVLAAVGAPAHLVGGSHGATVALHAVRAGAPPRSLVVFEPPLYSAGPDLDDTVTGVHAARAAGDDTGALRLFLAGMARMPGSLLPAPGADPPPADLLTGALGDLAAAHADTTDLGRWASIAVPTLVLHGERTWDPMPATMRALHAALPAGAARVELAGQTHFATHEAPDAFAAAVVGFVRNH